MATKEKGKKKKSGTSGGSAKTPGPITMRMQSIPKDARDNVPRTDDSIGPLVLGLLLVLAAVIWIGLHFWNRLTAPVPENVVPEMPGQVVTTTITELPLIHSTPPTYYAYDASGRYLIPIQVPTPPEGADPLESLRLRINSSSPGPGVERLLPGETKLRDLRAEGSLAIVDLAQESLDLLPGEAAKHALFEALTRTLTSLPTIKKVRFVVEGKSVAVTDDGVSLSEPWTVENVINPVTEGAGAQSGLFLFLDGTGNWLVPVTLPFEKRESPLQDKLLRLMEGPPPGLDLRPIIPSQLIFETMRYDQATHKLALEFSSSDPPQAWGLYHPRHLVQAIVQTLGDVAPIDSLTFTINDTDVWSVGSFAGIQDATAETAVYNPLPIAR